MFLLAGAAQIDISPDNSQFLYGYPHVSRYSTGIDIPLYSSSLFLHDKDGMVMFIGNDLIGLSRLDVAEIREKISLHSDIKSQNIMVTCTHTHSAPITVDRVARKNDDVVPLPDHKYMTWCKEQIIKGALQAYVSAEPVTLGFAVADSTGVGTNRRDPTGPRNPTVPVLTVKSIEDDVIKAIMLVCSMHPTVLHEDSTLISADFPGYCRKYLQNSIASCPVIYHTGPAGNQSPRYITRENTPSEAERIGNILGKSVKDAICEIKYNHTVSLTSTNCFTDFPLNNFPDINTAYQFEQQADKKFKKLKQEQPQSKKTRTAECDWFGAERRLQLAEFNKTGELAVEAAKLLPAEVQIIKVGTHSFVSWPGEVFVEYGIKIMNMFENTFVIAYANGETQGYLVTEEAYLEGGYEAGTAIFKSPESPNLLVSKTIELMHELS